MGYQLKIGMLQQTRATFAEKTGQHSSREYAGDLRKSHPQNWSVKSPWPRLKWKLKSNLRQHSPKNWYIVYLYSK